LEIVHKFRQFADAALYSFPQVKSIFALGFYSIMTVPPTIAAMNVFWFWKISKGMVKTLCKSKSKALNGNGKTD
jgi:hypothetical protein